MSNNLVLTISQVDLPARAAKVRAGLDAAAQAGGNMLTYLIGVGEELIEAKKETGHGYWLSWLKACDARIGSEASAERYMRLARGKALLNSSRMTNLSLTRALQIIKQAGPKPVRSRPARSAASKPKKVTSFDALAWWLDISPEQRRHFIDGIGSRDLAAAIPPSWNLVLVRADAGESIGRIGRLNERIAQLENKLRDRNRRIEKLQRQLGPVFGVAKAEASPEKPASDLDADLDILPAAGGDSMMCTPIGADADVHVAKGPR